MLTVQAVLYLCAKFRNFPASGSMGCGIILRRRGTPMITIGA